MPRFFLHVREGARVTEDIEGAEFPSLAEARAEAIKSARELMSDKVTLAANPVDSSIEIADESGTIVLIVPFEDAIGGN
jgi:hypothetical protein